MEKGGKDTTVESYVPCAILTLPRKDPIGRAVKCHRCKRSFRFGDVKICSFRERGHNRVEAHAICPACGKPMRRISFTGIDENGILYEFAGKEGIRWRGL